MPARLVLLQTLPGTESEVRDAIRALPGVAACSTLFEGHVVARVTDPATDHDHLARIDGVQRASVYA